MNVSQIMTRTLHTCGPDDSAASAAALMWNNDVGCVPVVDGGGQVVGMITDRDICMATYMRDEAPSRIPVSSVMAREVHACTPHHSLVDAEEIMRSRRIRRMPVVDERGALVGLLSINDLAREAIRQQGRRGRELGGEEVAATLAAVSQPRRNLEVTAIG